MNDSTKLKLEQFARLDTFDSKHPEDLIRFYKFVSETYSQSDKVSKEDFERIIRGVQSKITDDFIDEYYRKYETGREAIQVHETGNINW